MISIGENTQVTMNFALKLSETEVIDSTYDKEPATFTIGDGNLLVNFERLLYGLKPGDSEIFRIDPEEGFGPYNEDNLQKMPLDSFADMELSIGLVITFTDPASGDVAGVVIDYDQQYVTVDFNHPLAGKELLFEVDILQVNPASIH